MPALSSAKSVAWPRAASAAVTLLYVAVPLAGAWPKIKTQPKVKTPATSATYDEYIARVRKMNLLFPASQGSLWVETGPLAVIAADYKARQPGDLVVIHLIDSFSAATAAENSQSRAFAANSSVTGLLGTLGAKNRLQNLVNANSSNTLDGKGSSTLSSNVTLNLSAHVMETLPNGVLVVEAARDITVGNDRQTVYIRGLVRPGDLAQDNSVPSTAVSDLQVEIKGKGAIADITRQPNIVVRTLLKILTF